MGERAHTRGRDDLFPIDWVKKYRAIAGCTLREAKDAYDAGRPMPTSSAEIDAALERDAKRQALRDAAPDMFEAIEDGIPILEAILEDIKAATDEEDEVLRDLLDRFRDIRAKATPTPDRGVTAPVSLSTDGGAGR